MLADRVALLENGRITAVGRHSELLASNDHYRFVISSLDDDNKHLQEVTRMTARRPVSKAKSATDYTRDESSADPRPLAAAARLAAASAALRVVVTLLVIVVSTALQVAGPALIAFGIDQGLPALVKRHDWMPLGLVVGGI